MGMGVGQPNLLISKGIVREMTKQTLSDRSLPHLKYVTWKMIEESINCVEYKITYKRYQNRNLII